MPTPLTARALSAPDPTARPSRRAGAGTAAVVAVGLLLGACSSHGEISATPEATDAPATTASTIEPATTTTEALTAEQLVGAVYRRFWTAVPEAGSPPDPAAAILTQTMTGEMLDHARAQLQNDRETGLAVRLPETSISGVRHLEVDVRGGEATVRACVVDDAQIVARSNGSVLNNRVVSGWTEARLVLEAVGWRVVANQYVSKVEGASACG